jgi:hypothetical protein
MRSVRIGVSPNEADVDELAVQCVCAVELAASVLELTDLRGSIHSTILAVRPIDAPLPTLRIIEMQSQPFDWSSGTVELHLFDIGAAIPHFALRAACGCLKPRRSTFNAASVPKRLCRNQR